MSEHIKPRLGFDLDDTLVGRELLTRMGGALKGLFLHSIPYLDPSKLPQMDHGPSIIGGYNEVSLHFHRGRRAYPGAIRRLEELAEDNDLYIITGRPAIVEWRDATIKQIRREGIPVPEENVFMTPNHESTIISKAHAIKMMGIDEYWDDNLRTQLALSACFPNKKFNWIRYGVTDTPVDELLVASRDNLHSIPISEWK